MSKQYHIVYSGMFKSGKYNGVVVVLPSYNASYNITKVIDKILRIVPKSKIFVVDDNSPDKTYELIRKIYNSEKRVKLIIRKQKAGRGSAVICGIKEGLKDKKNKYFIEMDADFSHDPKYIPELIEVCNTYDVSLASKYLKESKIINLPYKRKLFSIFANLVLKTTLGIPVNDYTNGFRCYRREVLEKIDLDSIKSKGFIVLSEILYLIHKKGFSFGEIPFSITYHKEAGSNFNIKEIKEAAFTLFKLT